MKITLKKHDYFAVLNPPQAPGHLRRHSRPVSTQCPFLLIRETVFMEIFHNPTPRFAVLSTFLPSKGRISRIASSYTASKEIDSLIASKIKPESQGSPTAFMVSIRGFVVG